MGRDLSGLRIEAVVAQGKTSSQKETAGPQKSINGLRSMDWMN